MFRKRTHDIMNKMKDKENKDVKLKVLKEECKASNISSGVVVVTDRPSISKSDCSAGIEVNSNENCNAEEAVEVKGNSTENASIGLEDAVTIWVEEDNVIIENFTGDPEVGLGLEINEQHFEQYNDSELIDDFGLDKEYVNCDQGRDLSVNEDSMYENRNVLPSLDDNIIEIISADNNTNETADRPARQDLTKKGTVRKRKLPVESKEEREAKKKNSLKEKHSVLPPCDSSCFLLCSQNISDQQRYCINQAFWEKSWADRKVYILTTCERLDKKRKTTDSELISKRNKTFQYFLLGENGQKCRVCKTFFLATLGYKPKNDRFVFETLSKTPKNQISPVPDKRGKKRPANLIPKDEIVAHILSFQPKISHYRREHAPKTLYLPSDVTITLMHKDFLEKHPNSKCSYEVYRCQVKKLRISFAKLGNEECETCEQFKLHGHKENNLIDGCQECVNWTKHINAAKEARDLYQAQKKIVDPTTLVVSGDLQKIIMLPRVETFKKVLFTKRLVAYHESFVPVGDKPSTKPYAVVWHEAITGRNKEDLISTFYAFLKEKRDFKHIKIWLDNCSSQNKNWYFYTFLVQVINSNEISCDTIEVNYFEAGHTFMSADSFHHNVEQSLKKAGKVYDFQDFVVAVKNARKEVDIKEMTVSDFYLWKDLTSQQKLKKDPNRTYMCEIVQVKAKRGCYALEYKTSFTAENDDQEPRELDFLMNKVLKKKSEHFVIPEAMSAPDGFPKEKRDNILKELGGVIPENRKLFWMNLPIKD